MQVCPKDFRPVLLKYVDPECLPEYLGGTSKHTLLDDAGPWHDPKIMAAVDADSRRRRGHLRQNSAASLALDGPAGAAAGGPQEPPSPVVRAWALLLALPSEHCLLQSIASALVSRQCGMAVPHPSDCQSPASCAVIFDSHHACMKCTTSLRS